MEIILLALLFLSIAFIYSSAGFGGGSSYIALLIFMNMEVGDIRFIALVCNIIVVSGSVFNYYKAGLFDFKKVLPIVILSVPMAFLGGKLSLDEDVYKMVAAIALIVASSFMLFYKKKESIPNKDTSTGIMVSVGGAIGLLSGYIGVGGGVFLSPTLHIMRWDKAKVISAAASFFILVNSMAGISGQIWNDPKIDFRLLLILGFSVLIGGQIGNRLSISTFKPEKIRFITALLIGFVGWRLLYIQMI